MFWTDAINKYSQKLALFKMISFIRSFGTAKEKQVPEKSPVQRHNWFCNE